MTIHKTNVPGVGKKTGLSIAYIFTELASKVIDDNFGWRLHMGVEGVERVLPPFVLGYDRSSVRETMGAEKTVLVGAGQIILTTSLNNLANYLG